MKFKMIIENIMQIDDAINNFIKDKEVIDIKYNFDYNVTAFILYKEKGGKEWLGQGKRQGCMQRNII